MRVPPEGPLNAEISVVGEGPGREELRAGRPFVGPSGKELDKLLSAAGLRRSDVYITNVTKDLPKGNKDELFFKGGSPTQFYMEGILELLDELKRVRPNVVVPVGNWALWALTQRSGITKYRGSILESTLIPGLKVIPTIHPAWYLRTRMWNKFPLSEWDWQRISAESRFSEIIRPQAEFITNPTPQQISDAISRFLLSDEITIDTEWYNPDTMAYCGFSDDKGFAITIPYYSMYNVRAIKEICSLPNPKVMQNAMFDVPALHRIGIDVSNLKHDTMIAWHCCWGDLRQKDLGTISSVLTKWPYYKDHVEFVGRNDEKGQEYCCTDCVVTHESMDVMLRSELSIAGGRRGYDISMSIAPAFLRASKIGIRCDVKKLRELRSLHQEKADAIQASLTSILGVEFNPRSAPQTKKIVYGLLGIKRQKQSTSREDLMDIAASMKDCDEKTVLMSIIWVRRHLHHISNFLTEADMIDHDGRVRCNWNLAGTKNGRLSTSKPWWPGIAIQTVPTYPMESREIYISDPGYIFVGWDLEQAEARVVAVLTGDFNLLDDMENGIDIHLKLASQLPFGLTLEQLEEKKRVEGKEFPERILAKTTRHAKNYFQTWTGLKRTINKDYIDTKVGVTAADAKILDSAYMDLHPGLESWWHGVDKEVRDKGYLINAHGRRRNILGRMRFGDPIHRDAIAFYPQSTISDSTTLAIAEMDLHDWIQPMAHMHDGGFVQVPEDRVEEAKAIIKAATNRPIIVKNTEIVVPSVVKSGYNWKEMG